MIFSSQTSNAQDSVMVILPDLQAGFNQEVTVPVVLGEYDGNATPVTAIQFTLQFDPDLVEFVSATNVGTNTNGWFLFTNPASSGSVVFALAGTSDSGSGTILNITLRTLAKEGTTPIELVNFDFNEGVPPSAHNNGSLLVDMDLPVTWNYVEATADGMLVTVKWGTLDELNNSGFNVQSKLPNEVNYTDLGFVKGKGTINEPSDYTFTATFFNPGDYLFRLKQVDFDGTFSYSDEVGASIYEGFTEPVAYPNPFNPETNIVFSSPIEQSVTIVIYDAIGRTIMSRKVDTPANTKQTVGISFSSVSTGTYFASVKGLGIDKTIKLAYVR